MTVAPEQFDPAAAAGACPEWRSLPGEFFTSDEIYRADTDRVWRRGWLFAGHDCEIPSAGDYFTFNVGTDPLIVMLPPFARACPTPLLVFTAVLFDDDDDDDDDDA